MSFAILRTQKLKGFGGVVASELHTKRGRETPNADATKQNECLIGSNNPIDLETRVFERIGDNGGRKVRTDAVLCVEMLLSASPEFFRPDKPEQAGYWHDFIVDTWKAANVDWLTTQFSDRLVQAELHLDESTPHIHAYFVPMDEKGHLNCKSYLGGRQKLAKLQDDYAAAMSGLGLQRGTKGSRATHTKIKEYYAAVEKAPDLSLTPQEIHHQLADHQRVVKERDEAKQTIQVVETRNQKLEKENEQLRLALQQQQQLANAYRRQSEAMLQRLRACPLEQVAAELNLTPDPHAPNKWVSDDHEIRITGSQFYDFQQGQGGGGAIDLVMRVQQQGFMSAVSWLRDRFGDQTATDTVMENVQSVIQGTLPRPFEPPVASTAHWPAVRHYLTEERCLPGAFVDQMHQLGRIYSDANRNAVFLCRDLDGNLTGASLRGTIGKQNEFKGVARGSRRTQGWFYFGYRGNAGDVPQQVVLCESPIEALSYLVSHPSEQRTLYLAMNGAGTLPTTLPDQAEIVIAFKDTDVGNAMARTAQERWPQARRELPRLSDWNADQQHYWRNEVIVLPTKQKRSQKSQGPQIEL